MNVPISPIPYSIIEKVYKKLGFKPDSVINMKITREEIVTSVYLGADQGFVTYSLPIDNNA